MTTQAERQMTAGEVALVARYEADVPGPDAVAERVEAAIASGGSVAIVDRAAFALLAERAAAAGYRLLDGSCGSGAGGWAFVDAERREVAVLIAYRVVDGRVMIAFHGERDGREHMPAWIGARLPSGC